MVYGLGLTGPYGYMLGSILLTLAAILVAQAYEFRNRKHDSREVVIDEVAGYVIAMTWMPLTWQAFALSFVVFRLLDGVKPFPVSWVDRQIQGGVGVVADDVVAGILTNIALQVVYVRTDWLGQQLVFPG